MYVLSVSAIVIISYYHLKRRSVNKKYHSEYLETECYWTGWLSILPHAFSIMKFGQTMA